LIRAVALANYRLVTRQRLGVQAMFDRRNIPGARQGWRLRIRRGAAQREVSPILAIVLGVVAVLIVGGGFYLIQRNQAVEATKRSTSKEGAQKFFSNPENLRRAREAAGATTPTPGN
jgi:hypothetical protein